LTVSLTETATLAFLPNIGVTELLIVLAIVVLILGPKQIPRAARSLGSGLRNFRSGVKGEDGEGTGKDLTEKSGLEAAGEAPDPSGSAGKVAATEKGENDA
jgi:sec-independent protein translocase protein TatA